MDREINYSIIIPHKNISELLQRCLNSIPRREDVEIIVIDDNSDSEKVNFEKFPGLDDPFVEVLLEKKGGGAGYARNIGLSKATGKWLLFADADDYFTDGFLQHLDKYKEADYDLIYFGIYGIHAKTKQEYTNSKKRKKLMRKAIESKKYDRFKYSIYAPWGKMIKRELVKENNIEFDEVRVLNDVMFSVKTAYCAKNIFFDEGKIYTFELRSGSIRYNRTLEANFDRFCVIVRLNSFLKKIGQERYKINLIPSLWRITDVHNMIYFHKGMELIKTTNINLFMELFQFCLFLPCRIIIKIRNKVQTRYVSNE